MYLLVIDWFDYNDEYNNKIHIIPAMDAGAAVKLAHYIAYTKAGYLDYDMPKNIYLYEVDAIADDTFVVGRKYEGYNEDNNFLASWTDVNKNIHY